MGIISIAARFVLAKDYPNLIEAFRQVHSRFPATRLAIAGEGILRQQIEDHIHRAGLTQAVSLLGLQTDMPGLMCAGDAFVMASAWEGCPLALMEACACEKPGVSTNVGGAAQIIEHKKTGLVVPARDSAALAGAMVSIMALDSAARARMGSLARRRIVKQFSLEAVHRQYVSLYERILAEAR